MLTQISWCPPLFVHTHRQRLVSPASSRYNLKNFNWPLQKKLWSDWVCRFKSREQARVNSPEFINVRDCRT